MISCKLYGRLGNQAFQIAACIGHAAKMDTWWNIPSETLNPLIWPSYFSGVIPIKRCLSPINDYHEPRHDYCPIPYINEVTLNGYFQSDLYFSDCMEEVRDAFKIPTEMKEGVVAVHYRAGDYRWYLEKHPIVSNEYITSGIKYFYELGYREFMLFSDELETLSRIVSALRADPDTKGIQFYYAPGRSALEDFYLMSACEHGIVSNSTFSVMAHIMNRNADKKIVRPSFFFGPGNAHLNEKDIYPKNWITL